MLSDVFFKMHSCWKERTTKFQITRVIFFTRVILLPTERQLWLTLESMDIYLKLRRFELQWRIQGSAPPPSYFSAKLVIAPPPTPLFKGLDDRPSPPLMSTLSYRTVVQCGLNWHFNLWTKSHGITIQNCWGVLPCKNIWFARFYSIKLWIFWK